MKPIEPVDFFDDEEENEFIPCDKCDGHPACEDFGCAIELRLGRMVKRRGEIGSEEWDWSK